MVVSCPRQQRPALENVHFLERVMIMIHYLLSPVHWLYAQVGIVSHISMAFLREKPAVSCSIHQLKPHKNLEVSIQSFQLLVFWPGWPALANSPSG